MPSRQPRLGVTVSEDMYRALEEESKKNFNAPISALVRQALEDFLTARGYKIRGEITWGGYRREQEGTDDPEGMAVAAP